MSGSKAHIPSFSFLACYSHMPFFFFFLSRMLSCASKLLTCWLPLIVSWKFVQHSVCPAQGHLWHEERPQYILVYFMAKWAEMWQLLLSVICQVVVALPTPSIFLGNIVLVWVWFSDNPLTHQPAPHQQSFVFGQLVVKVIVRRNDEELLRCGDEWVVPKAFGAYSW